MASQINIHSQNANHNSAKNILKKSSPQDVINFNEFLKPNVEISNKLYKIDSRVQVGLDSKVLELVKEMGKKYNNDSIKNNKEYGGYIYLDKNKLIASKAFKSNSGDSVSIDMLEAVKLKRNIIVDWHTHGGKSIAANVFSPSDIISANGFGNSSQFPNFKGSYLFSPDGHMTFYKSNSIPTKIIQPYQDVERIIGSEKMIAKDFMNFGKDYGEKW